MNIHITGERIGAALRWIARGRSAGAGACVVVLAGVQSCVWIAPFPEPSRLLRGAWWHPGLLGRALVERVSDAAFVALGPLALILPLVAIWLLRHPARARIAPRLGGLWLGVAILLELAGGLPSRVNGGLPGAGVVALLRQVPGPPAMAGLVTGLVGLALIVWSLRLGGPILIMGRRAGAFACSWSAVLKERLVARKRASPVAPVSSSPHGTADATAEPATTPEGTAIEGGG